MCQTIPDIFLYHTGCVVRHLCDAPYTLFLLYHYNAPDSAGSGSGSGGDNKPAARPAAFNYTQEEFSADVFWGESPPTDEYPEIFDDRFVNAIWFFFFLLLA